MRDLCGSEEIFRKVKSAVRTRHVREQDFTIPPSKYNAKDKSSYFIVDHRSNSCVHGLHVSLQVEAFGHFVDEIDGKACVDPKFCQLATTLMKKMSKQYDSEYDRETQFREAVNEYFPSLIVSLPKPKPNTFPISTDGTMTVPGLKKHIKA